MSDLRQLAHLCEQLGEERFAALIKSDNTGKVKVFCDGLVRDAIPTEITVGGHVYEILPFLREGEDRIKGDVMIARAVKMSANLGEEDGRNLLGHQDEIPVSLRDKVVFIFPGWRRPDFPEDVACVLWHGGRWIQDWDWLDDDFDGDYRVLRRK